MVAESTTMTPDEAKVLADNLRTIWGEMKPEVKRATDEIKRLDRVTGEQEQMLQRFEAKMVELETKLNRPIVPVGGEDTSLSQEARERKRVYFDTLRQREGVYGLSEEDRQLARKFGIGPITPAERKALALGDDTTGGFLAPPEYVQDIIKGVQLISPIRGVATVRTTSRRSVSVPVRQGVFAAQWVGETATRSETTGLAYSLEEIPTYELYAEVIVSEQDLEDSAFDLEAEIRDNAAEQLAKAEGAAFVVGDSVKKPEGYMTNAAIATDVSGSAGTIASPFTAGTAATGDGLVKMAFNLKTAYAAGATWALNRKSVGAVRRLMDGQSRYLWEPAYSDSTAVGGNGPRILGIPYIEVPDMADEGANNFPIALGNFRRGCILVDRVDIVVKRLNELYANQGQVAFLVRKRVGFQVVLPEAIRKYQCHT